MQWHKHREWEHKGVSQVSACCHPALPRPVRSSDHRTRGQSPSPHPCLGQGHGKWGICSASILGSSEETHVSMGRACYLCIEGPEQDPTWAPNRPWTGINPEPYWDETACLVWWSRGISIMGDTGSWTGSKAHLQTTHLSALNVNPLSLSNYSNLIAKPYVGMIFCYLLNPCYIILKFSPTLLCK